MVRKPRITPKPKAPMTTDTWVTQGGLDPELPTEKPKTYPHRISFDMDTAQYRRLKRAAFECEQPMNEILRDALEDWLSARQY